MTSRISRIQLLRGGWKDFSTPIRPPWAVDEELFTERCQRCDDCMKACDDEIISVGAGGFPQLDFSQAGCDFCGDCVKACTHNALLFPSDLTQPPWVVKAEILSNCLSLHGTVCRSCGEVCDERAIRFKLQVGGRAEPQLDPQACNGCGECYAVCPIKSIRLQPIDSDEAAA